MIVLSFCSQIIEAQAAVHQCKATVEFMEKDRIPYPATVNDEGMHKHAQRVGKRLLGEANVLQSPMLMASEDFSFYGERMQSTLFLVGSRNESRKAYYLHSPYFFLNEEVLPIGAAFHAAVAMAYLDHSLDV